jgi:hypothetical protein
MVALLAKNGGDTNGERKKEGTLESKTPPWEEAAF